VPPRTISPPPPRYITPPLYGFAPAPYYVVWQSAEPVTSRIPNATLPPAPRNLCGGGLFRGIFGGPTTTVRVFPPFVPRYSFVPQPNAPVTYASVRRGNAADYSIDPKYLRQVVPFPGIEKPGTIIIDTPNKFLYLIEDGGRAVRYGIGVGRPGFLWAGVKTVTAKRE
jgi:lipoprotein-anchoring transpeptidase ErfK/SrfK